MGAFNYDATPLGPLGCPVMIHKKTSNLKSWDFRSKEGWSVGVLFEHYRCQLVIPADTRDISVSDTVEFLHHFITTPTLTPEDRILHGINTLSNSIQDKPSITYYEQIQAITKLQDMCTGWAGIETPKIHKHEYKNRHVSATVLQRWKKCDSPRSPSSLQGC